MQQGQVGPATKLIVLVNFLLGLLFIFDDIWAEVITAAGYFPIRMLAGDGNYEGFLLPALLTPFTAAFLHGGVAHLLLNMMMLLLIGRMVEPVYGTRLFALLYALGIIAATTFETTASAYQIYGSADPNIPVVGASGALSAVIAAYAILFPNKPARDLGPIPAKIARYITLFAGWAILNLMFAFVAPQYGIQIAIWSHIGGFAAGLALAIPLLKWKYRDA